MACPTVSAPVMTQKEIFSISELGVELLVLLPEVDELEAVPDHGLCRVLGHVLMFFEVAEAEADILNHQDHHQAHSGEAHMYP